MSPNINIPAVTAVRDATQIAPKVTKGAAGAFGDHLKKYMSEINDLQQTADKRIEELATGQNANLHETMIAVEQAGISFRMMMQIRNKIVAAYEEVMRMGI